jgi:DNA-binding MarR family transcriptional regulator/ribosomal protein S18 acetylase RimI-like enzyme
MIFPDEEITDRVLVAIRRIMRAVDLHSRKLVQHCNLTGPQLVLLREIARNGPIPVGELARRANLSNATVTGIIDRLEKRDLVRRTRNSKDRRQVLAEATDEGSRILEKSPPLLQERLIRELEDLRDWERTQILASLERIAALMDVEHLDAAPVLSSHPLSASGQTLLSMGSGGEKKPAQKERAKATGGDSAVSIHEIRTMDGFPAWAYFDAVAEFLHENLKPYEDTLPDIGQGMRDAIAPQDRDPGFILLAEEDGRLVGALVMLSTGMKGYVPEHLLLFVAVDGAVRGRGIGSRLVRHAVDLCPGEVKLHVEYDNPARALYERLGFTSKYAEMRFVKQ